MEEISELSMQVENQLKFKEFMITTQQGSMDPLSFDYNLQQTLNITINIKQVNMVEALAKLQSMVNQNVKKKKEKRVSKSEQLEEHKQLN